MEVLLAVAALVIGFLWGAVHGVAWLQMHIPWLRHIAAALQLEAVAARQLAGSGAIVGPKAPFKSWSKLFGSLFGLGGTGTIFYFVGRSELVLLAYTVGLLVGFAPALLTTYRKYLGYVAALSLVAVLGYYSSLFRLRTTALPPPASGPPVAAPCDAAIRLRGVEFEAGKAVIRPDAAVVLDMAADQLRACPGVDLAIYGYADAQESQGEAEAQALSERRAEAVRSYLMKRGIEEGRLTIRSFGSYDPIASNDTPEGRARNRRVELRAH